MSGFTKLHDVTTHKIVVLLQTCALISCTLKSLVITSQHSSVLYLGAIGFKVHEEKGRPNVGFL
jgi:hypothetical protein